MSHHPYAGQQRGARKANGDGAARRGGGCDARRARGPAPPAPPCIAVQLLYMAGTCIARSSKLSAGFSSSAHSTAVLNLLHSATVTLASAGRGARPKRKLTAVARESWTIESSSSRRQQPNSERRTRSSTHTVNLPLLPAETANGAYGPQNSG